jgi:hypothetical protein
MNAIYFPESAVQSIIKEGGLETAFKDFHREKNK